MSFANWACLPDRKRCALDRPVAEEKAAGQFHVILPGSSEWGIGVPGVAGKAEIHDAMGVVCFAAGACANPVGEGRAAGPGFLALDQPVGALVSRWWRGVGTSR